MEPAEEAEAPKQEEPTGYENEGYTEDPVTEFALPKRKDYGISKIQIRPGKKIENDSGYDEPNNYLPCLPEIEENSDPYRPMPYIFRLPKNNNRKKVKNITAKCPPFHVQLDHTIAVLWRIFSSGDYNSPLGIAQLQWAYSFLKSIRNCEGEMSKDIKLCLQIIEEMLLANYADLQQEYETLNKIEEKIKYYDAFTTPSVVTKILPFSINYAEMNIRAADLLKLRESQKGPDLTEQELKEKINQIIVDMENFDEMEPKERERTMKEFLKFKDAIQRRCQEQMETLLVIQQVMKEVHPELFPKAASEDDMDMCPEPH